MQNEKPKTEEISKNTKIFGIASFLNDLSSEMMFPLLPFFLTNILFAPVIVIGILEGLGESIASITGLLSGVYSDKIGKRKKLIISGYTLSGVMKGFLFVITSWQPAVLIRCIERFGKGIREAPRDAMIGLSESKETLGRAFGYRKAMDSAGAIIGPLVAAILLAYLMQFGIETAYRTIFLVAVIPAVFSVIVLFFIKETATGKNGVDAKEIITGVLKTKNFKAILFAGFVFALGQFSNAFFLLKSVDYMDLIMVPIAYMAYNVTYTIFSLPAGRLADRLGAKTMITIAGILFLISIGGFAFFPSVSMIFLMFALLGLFMAIIETAPKLFIIKSVDKTVYASAIGFYGAVVGVAALPANLVAGVLWNVTVFGTNGAFVFSIATTLLSLVILIVFIKEG